MRKDKNKTGSSKEPKNADLNQEAIPEKLFAPRKIYLKDVSFEAPCSPEIFIRPDLGLENEVKVIIDHTTLDEKLGLFEVVLKITVVAKSGEDFVYLAEIHQAGVFQINHPDPAALDAAREINCPHTLLPFAREEINTLITKGGFSSFLLTAINFETAYANKQAERQAEKKQDAAQ